LDTKKYSKNIFELLIILNILFPYNHAAVDGDVVSVLTPDKEIPPGAKIE
jgi:hypothetical protein